MKMLRLGAGILNQTPLDWHGNLVRIRTALDSARRQGVQIVLLPELAISGYGCEDAFLGGDVIAACESSLVQIARYSDDLVVFVGLPWRFENALYNCAAIIQNGTVLGLNAKRYLPRDGVHYEPRWFTAWPLGRRATANVLSSEVPFGDFDLRFGDLGVACEICEEAWGPISGSARYARRLDLVVNPSASHFAIQKVIKREQLVANASRALGVHYLYANLVGLEAGRLIYDGGALLAGGGEILSRGPRFGWEEVEVSVFDIDIEANRVRKIRNQAIAEEISDLPDPICGVPISARKAPISDDPSKGLRNGHASNRLAPEVEFFHATTLGLHDYLRKSGAHGYVVSLSGGCDSTVAALLVGHMYAEGCKRLSREELQRRLRKDCVDAKQWIKEGLFCVYQRTKNSSAQTEAAASKVARSLHALFHVVDVQPLVDDYLALGAEVLERPLSWRDDDLALQNIQARSRAPFAWLVANLRSSILLTTGNRSEAAAGYCTMDGDTAGGLAPLAGIDKHFLRRWLAWAERQTSLGLGSIDGIDMVLAIPPTAELRPPDEDQTDEDDLMPYDILDAIERFFVRDRMGADEIAKRLRSDFRNISEDACTKYVEKFVRLWKKNQWKRERLAPSFHLDDESLDPKTWCRYPILSGDLSSKPVNRT